MSETLTAWLPTIIEIVVIVMVLGLFKKIKM
jgi:hypothetical protein